MASLLRLSLIDFRYILKAKELWISLTIVIAYTLSLYFYSINSNQPKTIDTYYQIINDLSFYIFIIIPSLVLSKDYAFKTSRILYTGAFSKLTVVLSKMFSVLIFYFLFSIVHRLGANSLWMINQKVFSFETLLSGLPITIVIYMIIGISTCLLAFLITLITYSRMATLIAMFAFFIIEKYLRGILLLIFPNRDIKLILNHNPIAISIEALQYNTITLMDCFIVLFTSIFIGFITLIVLQKKEIN